MIPKLTLVFCCGFFSSVISLTSVGRKEMTIVSKHYRQLGHEKGITKCVIAAISIISFIQLALKLIPCFWSIFTEFQNEVFSLNFTC